MCNTHSKLAASFFAVLATLVVSGMSINSAFAEDSSSKEVKAELGGDAVEVEDGDTVVVDVDDDTTGDDVSKKPVEDKKLKLKPKVATVQADAPKPATKEAKSVMVMDDDFSRANSPEDPVDLDSVVELAVRGALNPSGPAIGGTLGFSWRPANRIRLYAGFNASKGLLELQGEEKELIQFGFTAGVSRVVTRTVEVGAFGTMSWAYRDLVKETSTSFIGIGPGFRLNKAAGVVFFEAGIPIGFSKKFADGGWNLSTALQASVGFHF